MNTKRLNKLIDFLLYLNEKGLINNYDFDFEKEAKEFIIRTEKTNPKKQNNENKF